MYRTPGPHKCKGGGYRYETVTTPEQALICFDEGYYPTLPLAMLKPDDFNMKEYIGVQNEKPEDSKEKTPSVNFPSRDELEAACKEYGIKFTKRTKDESLYELINDHIKAMD